MSARTIDFDDEYKWGTANNNYSQRPYCEIIVWYNKTPFRVWCIVDSGADRLQLDTAIAHQLGIPLNNATIKNVQMANGSFTKYQLVKDIDLEIEGEKIKTDVLFATGIPPLLGRSAFLKAITIGIDNSGWLYKV